MTFRNSSIGRKRNLTVLTDKDFMSPRNWKLTWHGLLEPLSQGTGGSKGKEGKKARQTGEGKREGGEREIA